MIEHSLAEWLQDIKGLPRDLSDPQPLPPSLLKNVLAIPAPEPLDEAFQSRASRTFHVRPTHRRKPQVLRSALADGAWEVDGTIVDWGIPGRQVIDVSPKTVKHKKSRMPASTKAFIPRSASILVNPHAFPGIGQAKVSRSVAGRRFLLDGPNKTYIYHVDNRAQLWPLGYPWWCICQLKLWTRVTDLSPWDEAGNGTGFLAGRSVCVTASHLFPTGRFSGWRIDVVPGSWGGKSTLAPGAFTNVHSVLRGSASSPGSDIMVMGLYDPLGEVAGHFGWMTYNDRWENWSVWRLAGYPYDFAPYPSVQSHISIYDDDAGPNVTLPNGDWWDSLQLESYADSASGLSGGPIFAWFDDGFPYVVGVHKGRESIDYGFGTDANSVASGGRLLGAMINWARHTWD